MKVRILESENCRISWYNSQIGSIFNVQDDPDDSNYFRLVSDIWDTLSIRKDDCEIIPEEPAQPEPFDLQRALKGEKVMTRDGRVVTEITYFKTAEKTIFCVGGVCGGEVSYWDIGGHYTPNSGKASRDLFMAPREPETKTVWVNLLKDLRALSGCNVGGRTFRSLEEAEGRAAGGSDLIGTFPITFKIEKNDK